MALDLEALRLDHPFPETLQVTPDNTSQLENIQHLPYAETDTRIFSNQQQEEAAWLQRFIARLDGKIVAHCSVLLTRGNSPGCGGIYHVGVLPHLRNRGIGKAVVGTACAYAKSRGYRYVLLNGTGRRMYEQLGFRKLGDGFTWWLKIPRLIAHPPSQNEVALAEAIGRGDMDTLEIIAVNINLQILKSPLTNSMTLMQLAVHCRQPASAEWLLSRGITINALEAWDLNWKDRARAVLAEHPGQVNQQFGDGGLTILHIAVERNDIDLAKLAISVQPDLRIQDKIYKSTALDWSRHLQKQEITVLIETYINTLQ